MGLFFFQKEKTNTIVQIVEHPPMETEKIERTSIQVDDTTFNCKNDIELSISDLGIITFYCEGIKYTTNPTFLMVKQILKN